MLMDVPSVLPSFSYLRQFSRTRLCYVYNNYISIAWLLVMNVFYNHEEKPEDNN